MERWIARNVLHKGYVLNMVVGDVELDDGTRAVREVVEHPGGVAVVPVLGDSVVMVRQYRIALGKTIDEIPSGKFEGGESPEDRARAELEEETGYTAGRLVPVGGIYPSVGYTSEKIHMYLAFDLTKSKQNLDFDERIEVVTIPIADVREGMESHRFEDAKTIIGFYSLLSYIDENGI